MIGPEPCANRDFPRIATVMNLINWSAFMSMWNNKTFTENELSRIGKIAVVFLFVIPVILVTINNMVVGQISNPYAFYISLLGFLLFLISKLSLFRKGILVSFGTKRLTENMSNFYRIGYWLKGFGLIVTFFK